MRRAKGWTFAVVGGAVMSISRLSIGLALSALLFAPLGALATEPGHASLLKRGHYIVVIGGCNDCHTAGYAESGGNVPEKDWLTGNRLGWHGPWGTTYPPNLRLFMHGMTRAQWIKFARSAKLRPPMPSWALHAMTDRDLSAIYAFVRHLGPAGEQAPQFVPPGKKPEGAYVSWPAPPGNADPGPSKPAQ